MADRLNRRNFLKFGGLTAVAAGTAGCTAIFSTETGETARVQNPFSELVASLPAPDYSPSMERDEIALEQIPLVYPETAQAASNQLKIDLFRYRDILKEKQEDPLINPDLGQLFWQRTAGDFDYLQQGTLLEVVQNACNDIGNGFLEITPLPDDVEQVGFMQNSQILNLVDGHAYLSQTRIRIPEESLNKVDADGSPIRISNLQLLVTGLYEYTSRMSEIGVLADLNTFHYADNPPTTVNQIYEDVSLYKKALVNQGHRLSADQNMVQFAAAQSLAAIAGNSNARVQGLEYLESIGIYPNYVAAQNGDVQALNQLRYKLSVHATY